MSSKVPHPEEAEAEPCIKIVFVIQELNTEHLADCVSTVEIGGLKYDLQNFFQMKATEQKSPSSKANRELTSGGVQIMSSPYTQRIELKSCSSSITEDRVKILFKFTLRG
nr:hypothetical protein BgiMline_033527 [Biomphalaria glabrata]